MKVKSKLFEDLIDRFVGQCVETLSQPNQQNNAQKKIETLIDIYWEFVKNNLEFIQIFMNWFIQMEATEQKAERLQKIHLKFENNFREYLNEGIQEGNFC